MRKFSKKQYLVAGAAAVIVAAGTGAAYAYWSSTGGGSGTASVGAGTNDLVAAGDASTALVPGGSSAIDFTITNTNTTTSEHYTSVTYSIDTGVVGCLASDFTISGLPGAATIAAGATAHTAATIAMADTGVSQDACKSADLAITYTIN
jgi:hypothetical protein